MNKTFEIIDFHTHPFTIPESNICAHRENCNMSVESTVTLMQQLGISRICGSAIVRPPFPAVRPTDPDWRPDPQECWKAVEASNAIALELKEKYGDFYTPGFHVHPDFVQESLEVIETMHKNGYNLIGELVPYMHGWRDYSLKAFDEILDLATEYGMVVSFHSMGDDEMDAMVRKHPKTVFVAAHPGELGAFNRHMERMKMSDNYYLDVSGTGLFRHGMLRHAIDLFGPERILFGSDYPTCNPSMFVGGVLLEPLLTDAEKELVLAGNAKRLLGL